MLMSVNTSTRSAWQSLIDCGFFQAFVPPYSLWAEVMVAGQLPERMVPVDMDTLLGGLFQVSGVTIPLQLGHDPHNLYHTETLKKIQSGEAIAAHCLTEASAGSDTSLLQTEARCVGNQWLVSGEKHYICQATSADYGLLYARVAGDTVRAPYHMVCFLLDFSLPGVSVSPPLDKIGLPGVDMGTLRLNEVIMGTQHIIGKPTLGNQWAMMSTTFERLLIPLAFIQQMEHCYLTATQETRAEIYRRLFVAKSTLSEVYRKVCLTQWDRSYIKLGCLLKWQLSETYRQVAKLSGQDDIYRASLASWIYSGTNDVMKYMLGHLL